MPDKLPSEIIRITLDDATYKGTGAAIAPTYINYFFGNNGTGKTTIAKAIKTGSGVTYAPGKAAVDYLPLVYDQDFIDANMRSYHNLPGVFTMNEANVKIQEQIDRKTGGLRDHAAGGVGGAYGVLGQDAAVSSAELDHQFLLMVVAHQCDVHGVANLLYTDAGREFSGSA